MEWGGGSVKEESNAFFIFAYNIVWIETISCGDLGKKLHVDSAWY